MRNWKLQIWGISRMFDEQPIFHDFAYTDHTKMKIHKILESSKFLELNCWTALEIKIHQCELWYIFDRKSNKYITNCYELYNKKHDKNESLWHHQSQKNDWLLFRMVSYSATHIVLIIIKNEVKKKLIDTILIKYIYIYIYIYTTIQRFYDFIVRSQYRKERKMEARSNEWRVTSTDTCGRDE